MNLLGKGNDPKFWSETVRNGKCYESYREFQLKNWNDYCENDTFEALKYSEFRLYAINGNRTVFQRPYYRRRVQVETATILSLIYPEEQKYIDYTMDMIFTICNEYSWCIPAHLPNLLTEVNETHLDLFACETGYTLAEIDTLLGDRLDPLIRDRIRVEIKRRIVDSFIASDKWFWERNCTHNWAAVCGASVGCTFMLLFPELFDSIKPRLDSIMENFLRGYKEDGFCAEGTHYWHYGFGFFCAYAEMLRTFTDGKENYFERQKIHNIATFIQKMFLSENKSVSFSDCGDTLSYVIGLLHFLKKEYPDVVVFSPKYSYINDGCGRFNWLVRSATWLDEDIYNNPADENASAEYFAKETEWLIKRTSAYGFAAKAGHNNEPHNHNDIGSFIIARDGKQVITDPGGGLYCQQYFAPATRYQMIECSSLGHSLPFFGEITQKNGKDYKATDVSFENGVFSMNIASAYGDERVKSVERSFSFTEKTVTLNDKFVYNGDAPITERIVSKDPVTVAENKITVGSVSIIYDSNICDVKLSETVTSKNFTLYFTDFVLKDGQSEITLVFE